MVRQPPDAPTACTGGEGRGIGRQAERFSVN